MNVSDCFLNSHMDKWPLPSCSKESERLDICRMKKSFPLFWTGVTSSFSFDALYYCIRTDSDYLFPGYHLQSSFFISVILSPSHLFSRQKSSSLPSSSTLRAVPLLWSCWLQEILLSSYSKKTPSPSWAQSRRLFCPYFTMLWKQNVLSSLNKSYYRSHNNKREYYSWLQPVSLHLDSNEDCGKR